MDKITKIIGIIIVLLFLFGAAIDTHESIPDNAIVWGDDKQKKYYGNHTWKEIQAILLPMLAGYQIITLQMFL